MLTHANWCNFNLKTPTSEGRRDSRGAERKDELMKRGRVKFKTSIVKQSCRSWGTVPPPIFWEIFYSYLNHRGGQIIPLTLTALPPFRIFRASYGPVRPTWHWLTGTAEGHNHFKWHNSERLSISVLGKNWCASAIPPGPPLVPPAMSYWASWLPTSFWQLKNDTLLCTCQFLGWDVSFVAQLEIMDFTVVAK